MRTAWLGAHMYSAAPLCAPAITLTQKCCVSPTMAGRLALLSRFVEDDCIPAESIFAREMAEIEGRTGSRWTEIPPVLTKLKAKARSLGLWNLFMPKVCLEVQLQYA